MLEKHIEGLIQVALPEIEDYYVTHTNKDGTFDIAPIDADFGDSIIRVFNPKDKYLEYTVYVLDCAELIQIGGGCYYAG